MKLSWVMLLASETDEGTPSSGSTPTSAAAWFCEEDGEKWGYSKDKGTDKRDRGGRSWRDCPVESDKAWNSESSGIPVKMLAETQSRFETSCLV